MSVLRNGLILGLAALTLTACGRDRANNVVFDGVYYRGAAKGDRDDRMNFVATVRPVSSGLDGARAAALYEGTKYCITYIGRSDIDWAIGPETDADALPIEGDTLTYRGRCTE
ncbi:hypothetical protein [Aestuariicoccus sp. MJ-SS9]|uniref:hypothetical protein n=1 Tax=Aestuariicoccus sp. MJ-SS9 TaxID=3079855 RepID=UPI00290E06D2|nr:hypothetical protein [Aestuariicoccus sp. MJ-SS9]MDU8910556.1 hypothetical protein [Aestuariicoccus sp. MJ-SS9]